VRGLGFLRRERRWQCARAAATDEEQHVDGDEDLDTREEPQKRNNTEQTKR
jgi:hypothetical protein